MSQHLRSFIPYKELVSTLSNREIIGFGGTSGYDSTLNGKVLDLAIREAVNNLTQSIDSGAWKPN